MGRFSCARLGTTPGKSGALPITLVAPGDPWKLPTVVVYDDYYHRNRRRSFNRYSSWRLSALHAECMYG